MRSFYREASIVAAMWMRGTSQTLRKMLCRNASINLEHGNDGATNGVVCPSSLQNSRHYRDSRPTVQLNAVDPSRLLFLYSHSDRLS